MSKTLQLDTRPDGKSIVRTYSGTPGKMPKGVDPTPGDHVTLKTGDKLVEIVVTGVNGSAFFGVVEDIRDAVNDEHLEMRQVGAAVAIGEAIDFLDAHIFSHEVRLDA